MNVALREWVSVVAALGSGRQIVMLRKGGIVERDGFILRHSEFLLLPSYEHEKAELLQPGERMSLESQRPGEIHIEFLSRVTHVMDAPPLERLLAARDAFIWDQEFLKIRYEYRPELPLSLIFLRVYRLAGPRWIPERPAYAGCKSWVNLTEEFEIEGAAAVLDDQQYARASSLLTMCLCDS